MFYNSQRKLRHADFSRCLTKWKSWYRYSVTLPVPLLEKKKSISDPRTQNTCSRQPVRLWLHPGLSRHCPFGLEHTVTSWAATVHSIPLCGMPWVCSTRELGFCCFSSTDVVWKQSDPALTQRWDKQELPQCFPRVLSVLCSCEGTLPGEGRVYFTLEATVH